MNSIIANNVVLRRMFDIRIIPLRFARLVNLGEASILKLFKFFYYLFEIISKLVFFKPDIVYFTLSPTGKAFYRDCLYVSIIKFFQTKVVFHLHGKGIKISAQNPLAKMLYKFVFRGSNIILLSEMLYDDLEDVLTGKEHVFFLPNGLTRWEGKYELCCDRDNSNTVPTILFLSNLIQTKGVYDLLDAAKILKDKGVSFHLFFVGETSNSISKYDLMKYIRNMGLEQHVQYLGPKYEEDKHQCLSQADLFVYPTYKDSFPLVLLEAMQAALPIIATREGAIPSIVDDTKTGVIVEKRNVQELANKIEMLLKDRELMRQMGVRGRQKFEKEYTAEIFEQRLSQIFSSVINNSMSI